MSEVVYRRPVGLVPAGLCAPPDQPYEPIVLGMDISTKTGCCLLQARGGQVNLLANRTIKSPGVAGFARLTVLYDELTEWLADIGTVDLAVVEGYAFKNKYTLVTLVELGTMFRWALMIRAIRVVQASPNTIKAWATGNGHAKKTQMKSAVAKRWGFTTKSDDEADAFALATAGLAYLGAIPCTREEKLLVSQLSIISCLPGVTSL